MLKPVTYARKRGATCYVDIEAFSGTPAGTEVVRAVLKRAKLREQPPGDDAPEEAVFSILFVPAAGMIKAYWRITLSAEQTEALTADIYIVDVRIEVGVVVVQSESLLIDFRERVTEPA